MTHRPSTHDGSMKGRESFLDTRGSLSATKLLARPSTGGLHFMNLTNRPLSPVYRFRGGHSTTFSKSSYPLEKARGADVGTYDLTRFADDNHVNVKHPQTLSRHLSASFRSSGRSKSLMSDAEHYVTMGNEVKHSNMGPGFYDTSDSWASEERQVVSMVATRPLKCLSSELLKYSQATMNDVRPWRQPSPEIRRKPLPRVAGQPSGSVTLDKDALRERHLDILAVQKLPNYR